MRITAKSLALLVAYVNTLFCIGSVIFLVYSLTLYSTLTDLRPSLTDDWIIAYVKATDITMSFIWLVMDSVGILICIRAIKGVRDERVDLLAQYLEWKALAVIIFALHMVLTLSSLKTFNFYQVSFPLPALITNTCMFVIMVIYYKQLPEEEDDDSDDDD